MKIRQKKVKKRFLWLKFIAVLVLIVTTVVLLALSPLFNIKGIEVEGNRHYKSDEIITTANIPVGSNGFKTIGSSVRNILALRYGIAESNIKKSSPYIKSVTARFAVPSKVKITVVERSPAFIVPYMGANLLMDREGFIVDSIAKAEGLNLPMIKGLNFGSYELGQPLKADNPDKIPTAVRVMDVIESLDNSSNFKVLKLINYIDVNDQAKISLYLDSRITVNLGNIQDLNYRISFMRQVFQKNIKKGEKGTLDFTNGEKPSFIPEKN